VVATGAVLEPLQRANAVVWFDGRPETLPALPEGVRWVQLPGAGVDRWIDRLRASPGVVFTCSTGVYSRPVAEHALALLLAGLHAIPAAARASEWEPRYGTGLDGATVGVIGAGGIGGRLVELLAAAGAEVVAVTRRG